MGHKDNYVEFLAILKATNEVKFRNVQYFDLDKGTICTTTTEAAEELR